MEKGWGEKNEGEAKEKDVMEPAIAASLGLIMHAAREIPAARKSSMVLISDFLHFQPGVYAYGLELVQEELECIACLHPFDLA